MAVVERTAHSPGRHRRGGRGGGRGAPPASPLARTGRTIPVGCRQPPAGGGAGLASGIRPPGPSARRRDWHRRRPTARPAAATAASTGGPPAGCQTGGASPWTRSCASTTRRPEVTTPIVVSIRVNKSPPPAARGAHSEALYKSRDRKSERNLERACNGVQMGGRSLGGAQARRTTQRRGLLFLLVLPLSSASYICTNLLQYIAPAGHCQPVANAPGCAAATARGRRLLQQQAASPRSIDTPPPPRRQPAPPGTGSRQQDAPWNAIPVPPRRPEAPSVTTHPATPALHLDRSRTTPLHPATTQGSDRLPPVRS